MQTFQEALMDLTVVDGEVLCQDGEPFDRAAYSHFKYGWTPPALDYGRGLASRIGSRLFELAGNKPIIIVSAPYKYLPTASHAIAIVLLTELGRRAALDGREPPVLLPFYKSQVGDSSYAKSSESDRLKALSTLGLSLNESLITESHVLVVDDIRITGTAQKVTAAYLEPLQPASIWYLHAACLPEGIGRTHPELEDELNQTVEHTLEVILEQATRGEFRLNTRVLRLILETKDSEAFQSFVETAPYNLLEEIFQSALGNGKTYFDRYSSNLEFVYDRLICRTSHIRPQLCWTD